MSNLQGPFSSGFKPFVNEPETPGQDLKISEEAKLESDRLIQQKMAEQNNQGDDEVVVEEEPKGFFASA